MMEIGDKVMEIKPCPFCGGEASEAHYDGLVWIECDECGSMTRVFDTGLFYKQAIEAWNKRVGDE